MNDSIAVVDAAARLTGLSLADAQELRRGTRNLVLTCEVAGAAKGSHIFIKSALTSEHLLHTESSALRLLNALPKARKFVPKLLAYDATAGLEVIEWIDGACTLESYLDANDPAAARRALEITAHTLGRLHASTSALKSAEGELPSQQAKLFLQQEPVIREFYARAGVAWPRQATEEFQLIGLQLSRPGAWLAFTVGDMAPSNVLIRGDSAVFIDLEYAGMRHALYDAVFWRCICPFPHDVVASMDAAYREGSRGMAVYSDEENFARAMTALAAHRALWSLTWGAQQLWSEDRAWAPNATGRQLIKAWLTGFLGIADRSKALPAISEATHELIWALDRQWPEAVTPSFRALASGDFSKPSNLPRPTK